MAHGSGEFSLICVMPVHCYIGIMCGGAGDGKGAGAVTSQLARQERSWHFVDGGCLLVAFSSPMYQAELVCILIAKLHT